MDPYRNTNQRNSSDSEGEDEEIINAMRSSKRKEPDISDDVPMSMDPGVGAAEKPASESAAAAVVKKRKVNNIWTTFQIERNMTDPLNTLIKSGADRNVESYNYKLKDMAPTVAAARLKMIEENQNNAAAGGDEMLSSIVEDEVKEEVVNIVDLETVGVLPLPKVELNKFQPLVKKNQEAGKLAKNIAAKLKERNEDLIYKSIMVLGEKKFLDFVMQVDKIESEGGMKIMNGARRRTPGGILFFLIRTSSNLRDKMKDKIFGDQEIRHKEYRKKGKAQKKMMLKHQKKSQRKKALKTGKMETDELPGRSPSGKLDDDLPPLPTRLELFNREQNNRGELLQQKLDDDDESNSGETDNSGSGETDSENNSENNSEEKELEDGEIP